MDNYNYNNMLFFVDNIDNRIKLPNENIKYMDQYNDLKTLSIDHQNILKYLLILFSK